MDSNKKINNSSNKCKKCLGIGFIKIQPIFCSNCNGNICYLCEKKGGIIKGPWIVCNICHTTGKNPISKK